MNKPIVHQRSIFSLNPVPGIEQVRQALEIGPGTVDNLLPDVRIPDAGPDQFLQPAQLRAVVRPAERIQDVLERQLP